MHTTAKYKRSINIKNKNMTRNEKAEFAVKILLEYATKNGINGRDTTDLSPLEQWLILRLYNVVGRSEQLPCNKCENGLIWSKDRLKAKLIELLETLFMRNHITYEEYLKVDVDWLHDSINCLEAKPKALHSMKEDENYCSCSIPSTTMENTNYCVKCRKLIVWEEQ